MVRNLESSNSHMQQLFIRRISVPTPFPVGNVNLYLLGPEPLTIIDTGPKTAETEKILRSSFSEFGYGVEDIERIILTHGHVDHYGLARKLKSYSGAEIMVHENDRAKVEAPDYFLNMTKKYLEALKKSGLKESTLRKMEVASEFLTSVAEQVDVDRCIIAGDIITVADVGFKVLQTTGHTAGSISLYQPERRLLISGDSLLQNITPNALNVAPDETMALRNYLETLKILRGLEIETVLPGHGTEFFNAHEIIDQTLASYQKRRSLILKELNTERTAVELITRLFGRLRIDELFLALSEVLGHIEILRAEGIVKVRELNNVLIYKALRQEKV